MQRPHHHRSGDFTAWNSSTARFSFSPRMRIKVCIYLLWNKYINRRAMPPWSNSAVINQLLYFHISPLQALSLALLCARPKQFSHTLFVFAGVSFSVVFMFSFCSGFWLPIRIPPLAEPVLGLHWKWPHSGEPEGSAAAQLSDAENRVLLQRH